MTSQSISQSVLQCPKRTHWVSFRLLDESGTGNSFAGLSFMVEDSQGQQFPKVQRMRCMNVMTKGFYLVAALLLSGCTAMGAAVKEGVLSLTDRDSREHFTFAGELPENFGIEVSARYSPLNPEHCQTYSMGVADYVVREGYRQFRQEPNSKASDFSFDIPMSIHVGLCHRTLARVSFLMKGVYGEKDWEFHGDHGVIAIAETRPEGVPEFDQGGQQTIRGYCTWMFQISKLRLGELEKLLNCSRTGSDWVLEMDPYKRRSIGVTVGRDELPGKTVRLDMRVNPVEEPSVDRRWIQTATGWKPCQGTETSERCQEPPVFKPFQMNGRTCTVYPNCEE